jgi:Protein of unknown function (DUF3137)
MNSSNSSKLQYPDEINSFVKKLESERQDFNSYLLKFIAFFIVSFGVVGFLTIFVSTAFASLFFLYIIISGIILGKKQESLTNGFKNKIIPNIVKLVDPKLNFDQYCTTQEFRNAQILSYELFNLGEVAREIINEDLIFTNEYGNLRIFESKIRNKINDMSLFFGKILVADYPIKFHGKTIIKRKSVFNYTVPSYYQNVVLESPDFMNLFDVYSTNQVEARMCLQTDIMAILTDITNKFHKDIEICFTENKIFIALKSNTNTLELNTDKSIQDSSIHQEYYNEILTLINLAKA